MKRITQNILLALIIASCFSCNLEVQSSQSKENESQSKKELKSFRTITMVDTIITANAPARITRKIRKDKQGNLIFASYQDVIRYNGKLFSKILKSEGLESFDAFDAYEDKKGNIWIASTHLGLFRYDGKKYSHFTTKTGLASDRTMCIHEDKRDNIWIGTESGISFYSGKSFKTFDTHNGLTNNDINTIFEDKTGKIWIGTKESLCFYDPTELPKKGEIRFKEFNANIGKSFKNIWSIIEDGIGNLWLGGEQGLWRINEGSSSQVSEMSATGVYEDKKGNIWFTHSNDDPHKAGLSLIDTNSLKSNKPKINHIYIGGGMFFGISEDKKGNIWVGTLQGVLKYDGELITIYRNEKQ